VDYDHNSFTITGGKHTKFIKYFCLTYQ